MIMRSFRFLALLATILCLTAGWGLAEESASESPPKPQNKTTLIIATANTGGTYYPMGVSMATLWSLNLGQDPGIKCQAIPSAGSGENVNLLRHGEADLAIMDTRFGLMAWKGLGDFQDAPYPGLRTITALWPDVEHFVVLSQFVKTGTPMDVQELRFSIGKAGSGTEAATKTILKGLGLNPAELNLKLMGYFEASRAIKEGELQGANLPGGPPVAAVTDLFSDTKIKPVILHFTDEQIKQINDNTTYAGFKYTIAPGTYPHQTEAVNTIAQNNILYCRADLPEETVYLLTRALFENAPYSLDARLKTGTFINLEKALTGLPAPLHPGALRYYRENKVKVPEALLPPQAGKSEAAGAAQPAAEAAGQSAPTPNAK
ncbi:MAG: TAXI family TRAP transporter solute-binding subunit [Deltaproteobacteria bacterium]|nr:TAXI family TRAP transporter solute-binding subunit [Deltaproteobacteria bacterium]